MLNTLGSNIIIIIIEKVTKNGEANVPSGRPTQNYYYYYNLRQ